MSQFDDDFDKGVFNKQAPTAPTQNTFDDDFDAGKFQQPKVTVEIAKPDKGTSILQTAADFATGFNRSIEKLPKGVLGLLGASDNTLEASSIFTTNKEDLQKAQERSPTATAVGGITGDIAKSLPLAVAVPGGSFAQLGQAAAGSAALGALEAPDSGSSRIENAAMQGGLTATLGLAGKAAGALGKAGLRKLGYISNVDEAAAYGLKPNQKVVDAMSRKGVAGTPGELLDSMAIKADESRTPMGARLRLKTEAKAVAREADVLSRAANETFEKAIENPNNLPMEQALKQTDETIKNLFNKSYANMVPEQSKKALLKNPEILQVQRALSKREAGLGLAGKDPNSYEYWDTIRQGLSDKAKTTGTTAGKAYEGAAYGKAKEILTDVLKANDPSYKAAMDTYVKKEIFKDITNKLGSVNRDFTAADAAKKLFPNENAVSEFVDNMVKIGAKKQDAEDWATIIKTIGAADNPLKSAIKRQEVGLISAIKSVMPGSNGRVLLPNKILTRSLSMMPEDVLKSIRKAQSAPTKTRIFLRWANQAMSAEGRQQTNNNNN